MITPELKDKVLEHIISHSPDMKFPSSSKKLAEAWGENESEIREIIRQFEKRGFIIYELLASEGSFIIYVNADAHDYFGMGGHVGEFRVMELQFNKLQSELLALEKQFGKEPFRDLAVAANTLISFFQTIYQR